MIVAYHLTIIITIVDTINSINPSNCLSPKAETISMTSWVPCVLVTRLGNTPAMYCSFQSSLPWDSSLVWADRKQRMASCYCSCLFHIHIVRTNLTNHDNCADWIMINPLPFNSNDSFVYAFLLIKYFSMAEASAKSSCLIAFHFRLPSQNLQCVISVSHLRILCLLLLLLAFWNTMRFT